MFQPNRPMKTLAAVLIMGGLLMSPMALAAESFGTNWEPRPLVDTAPQPKAEKPQAQPTASQPARPDLEQALKPAEPFIKDVEARLFITPEAGTGLVARLNHLQTVLFGEQKYADAGELLAKMAELFPEAAAKARADLQQQMASTMPPAVGNAKAPATAASPANGQKPIVVSPPPTATAMQQPASKKRGFWDNDDDGWDSFENDPFFQDEPRSRSGSSSGGGSGIRALGQGLAGLAMLAGGLAGTYYLNKKIGSTPNQVIDPRYNYNTPYGYGYAPYGAYAPQTGYYGQPVYGGYPAYPTYPTYGTYLPNYGIPNTVPRYTPYVPGRSTWRGTSPLGTPLGF